MRQFLAVSLLVAATLAATLVAGTASADPDDVFGGTTSADGDDYVVGGHGTHGGNDHGSADPVSSSSSDGPPTETAHGPACSTAPSRADLGGGCPGGDEIVVVCLDGSAAQDPIWTRTQNAAGFWSDWTASRWYYCPGDAPLLAAIRHEWDSLKPVPSDIALEPNTGWVLASVPTVAMASDATRTHSATLLGAAVDIRATASGYRWQWGDGTHTDTTDPGKPYPHASLTHTYPHASDSAVVELTTTWTGQYRINGGPWIDFTSTIHSDSAPVPLTIYDPRSRLVDCDLNGQCTVNASA